MAEKLYQQANPKGAQGGQGFNPGVYDADFEEVKD